MNIQKLIDDMPLLKENVRSFSLMQAVDDAKRGFISISFELKERISYIELGLLDFELSQRIVDELKMLENEFRELNMEPLVRFFLPGMGPFTIKSTNIA
jgi:hypothetical protein